MPLLIGKGYKTRLLNYEDELWDRWLGVKTFGFYPGSGETGKPNWCMPYIPTPYRRIKKFFEMVELNEDDVFVDLGAGLGRSVFLARWMGAKKATGVDINPELCEKAIASLKNSKLDNVDFVCIDASDFSFSNVTVLFTAHSFGEDTLRSVVKNLENSRQNLRIIYVNPVCEHVFREAEWLECFGSIDEAEKGLIPKADGFAATFWRSSSR